jgi:competence ComEA-like helix-hairpin-helix protein
MSSERRAVLLLIGLAVAGQGIRYLVTRPDQAPGDIHIIGSNPGHSATTHAEAAKAAFRPLAPGERINVDRASAQELARLPRVGLALAKRIVADRDSNGPFGGLEGLDRVSGVGPGMLKTLESHLSFSVGIGAAEEPGRLSPGPTTSPTKLPPSPISPLDLNTATSAQLEQLPLIGPSLALRIIAWRERHGSFKTIDDLIMVPGISRRMADAIRDRIAFH